MLRGEGRASRRAPEDWDRCSHQMHVWLHRAPRNGDNSGQCRKQLLLGCNIPVELNGRLPSQSCPSTGRSTVHAAAAAAVAIQSISRASLKIDIGLSMGKLPGSETAPIFGPMLSNLHANDQVVVARELQKQEMLRCCFSRSKWQVAVYISTV
jgi:hypothetical protein